MENKLNQYNVFTVRTKDGEGVTCPYCKEIDMVFFAIEKDIEKKGLGDPEIDELCFECLKKRLENGN